ncbi:carbohydrate esterase family 9 protein [Coprinellus micaceus]|uniref:Carbohydrate esterase family 9 protein n=1 Tax=Coprinellus micaceus TaxID=71717 RepID=A0A4Y7TY26_COPMI|nr:carbohydrate esterase family 9 protein [Coprinellus micaceus]
MAPSFNSLVGFTNCLIVQEDGTSLQGDLWVDEASGLIVDAKRAFFQAKQRPGKMVDLGGNILSPGFLDIQINGAYGFDFSVYEGDEAYLQGMKVVAERIVETGVTSLLPTVITQEKSLYPKLLPLLKPFSTLGSATLLGWHAEGPFIEHTKRGAHAPSLLLSASGGYETFQGVYGADNLVDEAGWRLPEGQDVGVRMITAAPEIPGVIDALKVLAQKGIVMSIGHSTASTSVATAAVKHGARLITHLFNAMPQFHHRDPSIVGLLGSSPSLNPAEHIPLVDVTCEMHTPTPGTPIHDASPASPNRNGTLIGKAFQRPFYGIIVDGIHCHPNSVRLAYAAHPEGCILVTDAMKILDPHLEDGVHEWRDGKRFVKEGEKLYLEGTDTLAGSVVTLDKCVRNFSKFTGCSLGEAIRCVTYNPASCLGIESKKGTLRPGAHADLVVLDKEGNVLSTWVRGKQVFNRSVA